MQPCTPNCQQVLRSSLFLERGRHGSFLAGPRVRLRVPPGTDPVTHAENLMRDAGVASREKLRGLPGVPGGRWIVVAGKADGEDGEDGADPLVSAAILGLSGPHFYCPNRPLVWTRERLGRSISLHRLGGFYGD